MYENTAPLIFTWDAESKQWQELSRKKSLRAYPLSFAFGFNIDKRLTHTLWLHQIEH